MARGYERTEAHIVDMMQRSTPDAHGANIDVSGVSKWYRRADGSALFVLDNITFETEAHDFTCLLGPSGCGKSTLLSLIADLDTPTEGDVTVGDGSTESTVSFVFQDPRLLEWRTVRANLEFALRGMGVAKGEWEERIQYYLELVGLDQFVDEYPQSLSGGMKQRVALARALAVEADVILMDEPFGSLDEITARELRRDLIDIWRQEKKNIVFVTHNALEAAFLAQRILVLSQRPATVVADRQVDISHPRDLEDPAVVGIAEDCIDALHEHI